MIDDDDTCTVCGGPAQTPEGFLRIEFLEGTIEDGYLNGVTICGTCMDRREMLWTFANEICDGAHGVGPFAIPRPTRA